jgi:hypothetical protein
MGAGHQQKGDQRAGADIMLNGHKSNGNGHIPKLGEGAALDMTDGRDRKTLTGAISAGWAVKPEHLERYRKALDNALAIALQEGSSREIRGCVQTMQRITDQIQRDEHRQEPERIDHRLTVSYENAWVRKREANV